MRQRIRRSIGAILAGMAITALGAGCRSEETEGERVAPAQMSAPARAAMEKLIAGGAIEKIARETEKGRVLYDVEATVGGKHVEYAIADADGAVVGTETSIEFGELPAAVRTAAEKLFGGAAGLKAMKGVEEGVTTYEVEGKKDGKTIEANFDPDGKRIE